MLREAEIPGEVAVSVFLSASETHNRKNVNRSIEESLAGLERVLARAAAGRGGTLESPPHALAGPRGL